MAEWKAAAFSRQYRIVWPSYDFRGGLCAARNLPEQE